MVVTTMTMIMETTTYIFHSQRIILILDEDDNGDY